MKSLIKALAAEPPAVAAPPGAACFLCKAAGTPERPLHRDCGCHSAEGFAHLPCLAEFASAAGGNSRLWFECGLCMQERHGGAVGLYLAAARFDQAQQLDPQGKLIRDGNWRSATGQLVRALLAGGPHDVEVALALADHLGKHGDDEHPDTLANISALATIFLSSHSSPTQALPLAEQALQGARRLHGNTHKKTLGASDLLIAVACELGDYHKALPLAQEALAGRILTLGAAHTSTLASLSTLARINDEMGNKAGALPLYQELLGTQRKQLGSDHPETLRIMLSLGRVMCHLDDHSRALPLLRAAVAGFRKQGHVRVMTGRTRAWTSESAIALLEWAEQEEAARRPAPRRELAPRSGRLRTVRKGVGAALQSDLLSN